MNWLTRAIGIVFYCLLWLLWAVILVALIVGPSVGYWKAGGGLWFGLALIALFVGIGWISRPFKKDGQ